MEVIFGIAILLGMGWVAIKIMPFLFKGAWFVILFSGALAVIFGAKLFLEMTHVGLAIGFIAAVIGAWAFARSKM